jgi:hypothetical protein
MLRRAHALDGLQHFGTNLLILPSQIEHRHRIERPCA